MTIYEATANGPAYCLMGENRVHAIGDIVYRFRRQNQGLTLPSFARGLAMMFIDGEFRPVAGHDIIRNWSDKVTPVR